MRVVFLVQNLGIFLLFNSFSFMYFALVVENQDEHLIPRQHPFPIFKYFKYYGFQLFIDKNRENSMNFVGYYEIQRKYRFSSNFLQNLVFLTYVNFSLSAKFNRFFIILGGIEETDQKTTVFQKYPKIVVFRGFSWFFEKIRYFSNI